tara:strand:+ start:42 stop:1535 length:1494 start_codon:yes stop_codon:yes gene_type:complete
MSRQAQEKYLKDLLSRLEAAPDKSVKDPITGKKKKVKKGELNKYRAEQADIQTHHFKTKLTAIRGGIFDRLMKNPPRGYGLSQQDVNNFAQRINLDQKIKDSIKAIRDAIVAERNIQEVKGGITITNPTFNGVSVAATFIGTQDATRIYGKIANTYKDIMEDLAITLGQEARKLVSKKGIKKADVNDGEFFGAGEIWQLSHADDEGALESYLRAGINDSVEEINRDPSIPDDNLTSLEIAKAINAIARDTSGLAVERIIRETGIDEMNVFLDSHDLNMKGMGRTKRGSAGLKEKVTQLLKELRDDASYRIPNLPGSDSFAEIKRKKTIKKVIEPFVKIPGIEIKTDNIKVKNSKTRVESKSASQKAKPRIKRKPNKIPKIKQKPLSMSRRGMGSPTRLMALINAKLPQTVASNMGEPRLENRTGRFAASPRVVDVQQTPQGFPSIGYTYEKNPYSVFERTSGTRFADANRDPRDLIELSIREIAQQLTIGRFYTRRV